MKTSAQFSPWCLHMWIRSSVESEFFPQQNLNGRPFLRKSLYFSSFQLQVLGSPADVFVCFFTVNSQKHTKQSCVFFVTGPGARTLRKTYLNTAYLEKGEVKEELAQIWGTTRSDSGESVLVLKVKAKDDRSSDDVKPRYVYVRKSDLLSIEPVKWENHMALDPCLIDMN